MLKKLKSIQLRKIKKSDFSLFYKWWKDPDLIALTSGNFNISDEKLANYFSEMIESSKDHHFMIQLKDKIIGHLALIHKRLDSFELTIVVGEKEYWGKGFGVEAIKMAVSLGFEKFGYEKSYLEVRPENIHAIKAYEACGFVKKGLKKYPKNKDQPVTQTMILTNLCKLKS